MKFDDVLDDAAAGVTGDVRRRLKQQDETCRLRTQVTRHATGGDRFYFCFIFTHALLIGKGCFGLLDNLMCCIVRLTVERTL